MTPPFFAFRRARAQQHADNLDVALLAGNRKRRGAAAISLRLCSTSGRHHQARQRRRRRSRGVRRMLGPRAARLKK